jgi:1,4-alpha-glucan branching enzyme
VNAFTEGSFNDSAGAGPGTFDEIVPKLGYLRDLGINAIEIMPVLEFPMSFSWGYNPSDPFAVESTLGGPEGLPRFVKAAHALGIAAIMDGVYNHFGRYTVRIAGASDTAGRSIVRCFMQFCLRWRRKRFATPLHASHF